MLNVIALVLISRTHVDVYYQNILETYNDRKGALIHDIQPDCKITIENFWLVFISRKITFFKLYIFVQNLTYSVITSYKKK